MAYNTVIWNIDGTLPNSAESLIRVYTDFIEINDRFGFRDVAGYAHKPREIVKLLGLE